MPKKLPIPYKNITTKTKLHSSEQSNLIREMENWFGIGGVVVAVKQNKKPCHHPWRKRNDGIGYTEEEVFNCILSGEAKGIALVCGPTSGIVGVGCDSMEGGERLLSVLKAYGTIPVCYKSHKGIHFLFKNTNRIPHTCAKILPNYGEADIRSADKGYLLLPGSLHPSGIKYKWLHMPNFLEDGSIDLPELPEWLLSEIYKGKKKKKDHTLGLDDDSETDHTWGKAIEINDYPSLDPSRRLPSRILKGSFMKLFRLTLPKQRWEKFTKHAVAKEWILPGNHILEGERYYAERAIGGLAATCYAHPIVAIRLLETFRYVYIPTRRDRNEELEMNSYVESLCLKENQHQKNRNSVPKPPNRIKNPKGYERYWYNIERRNNSIPKLINKFYEKKICHKLYEDALSESDFVRFLFVSFRSRLIYEVVRANSNLRAIFDSLQNNTSIPQKTESEYSYHKRSKEFFGTDDYKKRLPLSELLLLETSKKKTTKDIALDKLAKEMLRERRARSKRRSFPKMQSLPGGIVGAPGVPPVGTVVVGASLVGNTPSEGIPSEGIWNQSYVTSTGTGNTSQSSVGMVS